MANEQSMARLHYELIQGLIRHNVCPSISMLAERLSANEAEVKSLLGELASIHGIVLHPHSGEPWVIHPFSLTPTLHWIQGETGSWWAPCIWCAFGVATLIGGKARIHTRYGAESEPLIIDVTDGRSPRNDIVVHFAIPPARAWDNVHQHCSLVLPFPSLQAIGDWCKRYGVPMGEVVPLATVSELARTWYGSHADPNWRKWSIEEAQQIFSRAGLNSEFWRLTPRRGHF